MNPAGFEPQGALSKILWRGARRRTSITPASDVVTWRRSKLSAFGIACWAIVSLGHPVLTWSFAPWLSVAFGVVLVPFGVLFAWLAVVTAVCSYALRIEGDEASLTRRPIGLYGGPRRFSLAELRAARVAAVRNGNGVVIRGSRGDHSIDLDSYEQAKLLESLLQQAAGAERVARELGAPAVVSNQDEH